MEHLRHSTYAPTHQADQSDELPTVARWVIIVLALAMLALTGVTTLVAGRMLSTPDGPVVVTPTPYGPPGPNGGPQ